MDSDGARATKAGAKAGVQYFTDFGELLRISEVDAVILAVPNNMHGPMSVQALEAGKHVLCEKPLAINPSEAERIVDAAESSGKLVKTASNHRFFPTVAHCCWGRGSRAAWCCAHSRFRRRGRRHVGREANHGAH